MFENVLAEKFGPLCLRMALAVPCLGDGYLKIYQMGGTTWAGATLAPVWQAIIAWLHLLSALTVLVGIRTRWSAALLLACLLGKSWLLKSWPGMDQIWPKTHESIVIWLLAIGIVGVGGGIWKLDLQTDGK